MPEYTVQDTESGKTITFEWSGAEPPNESDMEEVFAAARTDGAPQMNEASTMPTPTNEGAGLATGLAYASQLIPKALPAVNKGAAYVAESPTAQKVLGTAIGGLVGAGTKTDIALDALVGGSLGTLVGKGAAKLEKITTASRATVGRASNGQFVKLAPKSALTSVLQKAGQAVGAASAEADALTRLNSPQAFATLADALTPEAKMKLDAFMKRRMNR